jgi:phage tail-like protein
MANGARVDPFPKFNFLVSIDGVSTIGFSEVSGLTSDTNVMEYREGSDAINGMNTVRKLVGLVKFTNIVLKHGITTDKSLYTWRKTVLDGATQRANGSITLLDEGRNAVLSWNFFGGWCQKLETGPFDAKSSEVLIETCEIVHEGLELAT